jgi:hypothetical protein
MKNGFPFSRALAAWNGERVRGPLLAMVFSPLAVAVASLGALSHDQGARNVLQSARTSPPPGKYSEFFLHNLGSALADDVRVQANMSFLRCKSKLFPSLEFAREEV